MLTSGKVFMESSPNGIQPYSGKSKTCISVDQFDDLDIKEAVIRGKQAWGRPGVIVSKMAGLPAALYCGCFFDDNTFAIVPRDKGTFLRSGLLLNLGEFANECRKLNQKLNVTVATMSQGPFRSRSLADGRRREISMMACPSRTATIQLSGCLTAILRVPPTAPCRRRPPARLPLAAPDRQQLSRLSGAWPRWAGNFRRSTTASSAFRQSTASNPPPHRLRQLLTAALGTFDERALIASCRAQGQQIQDPRRLAAR